METQIETTQKLDYEVEEGDVIVFNKDVQSPITRVEPVDYGTMITTVRFGRTFAQSGTKFSILVP